MKNQIIVILIWLLIFNIDKSYCQFDFQTINDTNFFSIERKIQDYRQKKKVADKEENKKDEGEKDKDKERETPEELFGRWEWFWKSRVDEHGSLSKYGEEMKKIAYKREGSRLKSASTMSITWAPVGPSTDPDTFVNNGTGQIKSIGISPSGTLYAGSVSGGLWKRNGSLWTNCTDYYPVFGVNSIAFGKNGKIFIGTGCITQYGSIMTNGGYGFGVYSSPDAGNTWENHMSSVTSPDLFIVKVVVNPTRKDTVYALTRYSLYKSINGGNSWTKMINTPALIPGVEYVDIELKPGNPDVVFICTGGIKVTWDTIPVIKKWYMKGGTNCSIYRSDNGAVSWTGDLGQNVHYCHGREKNCGMAMAVTPADPSAIYIVYYRDSTFHKFYGQSYVVLERSVNDGVNWSLLVDSTYGYVYTQIEYFPNVQLAISPSNPIRIYVGGGRIRRYNSSIPHKFNQLDKSLKLHDDVRDIYVTSGSSSGDTVYVGTDGGIAYSRDSGTNWINMYNGIQIGLFYGVAISEIDVKKLLGGVGDCGTDYFNGSTWGNYRGGDGGATLFNKLNANFMYAGCNLEFDSTQTGWKSWGTMCKGGMEYATPIIQNQSNNRLYAVWADPDNNWNHKIIYSDNNGTNWYDYTPTYAGDRIIAMASSKSDQNVFYFAKVYYSSPIQVTLLKTTTGGGTNPSSWISASGNLGSVLTEARITDIEIDPSNSSIVYVCFGNLSNSNKVFLTLNGGTSWTNITYNLPNCPVLDVELDKINSLIYIATDYGVYLKDLNGTSWIKAGNFPYSIATKVKYNYRTGDLFAATWGRAIWKSHPLKNCWDGTTTTITSNTTWNTYNEPCGNLLVSSGTLTLTAWLYMPTQGTITVNSGANLVVNGGVIKNANIVVNSGGSLTLQNDGLIYVNSSDNLNLKAGSTFNQNYGSVLVGN
jgi:hypothetical protein